MTELNKELIEYIGNEIRKQEKDILTMSDKELSAWIKDLVTNFGNKM